MAININVTSVNDLFNLERKHVGDAGLDIKSTEYFILKPFERKLVCTGVKINIPYGYVGYVMSRSGIANNYGVVVLNSPGVIDHGYTGEILVNLINLGKKDFIVNIGDRIAQLIIQKIELPIINTKNIFLKSERGTGGHGSTGI